MSLWLLLAYLAVQVGLSVWLSRRIHSESDYFVAGRKLGAPLLAFSMFATWFGAETCLGSSGAIYQQGLAGGRADPFGYSLCLLLMGIFMVRRLWRRELLTLGDLFRQRFGPRVERLAVLVLVPSSLIWAAAQVRAFGQVVSATMDVDVTLAIYLSAAFVIAYTLLGGLLGDVLTDLIQGSILCVSLVAIVGFAFADLGGVEAALGTIDGARLDPFPAGESAIEQLDRFSIPIFGSLVAQELIARVLAAKSAATAVRASYFSCALYLAVGLSPVLLGLLGPALLPGLTEPEQLLPAVAERLLPRALFVIFSCALLSAILSTIDSILLASSALVAHNVLVPLLGVESERKKVLWARALVFVTGSVALVIALYAEGIYDLVETASAFGTAGVLVVTLSALYTRRGGSTAATWTLITGLVATPLAEHVLGLAAPFLFSVALSLVAYFGVAWREKVPAPSTAM